MGGKVGGWERDYSVAKKSKRQATTEENGAHRAIMVSPLYTSPPSSRNKARSRKWLEDKSRSSSQSRIMIPTLACPVYPLATSHQIH